MSSPKLLGVCLLVACRPSAAERPTDVPQTPPTDPIEMPAPDPIADVEAEVPPHEPGTIRREALDRVTARGPGWLLRELGPEPYKPRGKFEGWRITAVFPDAPEVCTPACDLLPGDVILSVGGDTLETPDAYTKMFEKVDGMQTLQVVRLRAGARETVEYRIVPQ